MCYLRIRPAGGRLPKRISDMYGADDIRVELVFYSTFKPLDLPCSCPTETQGVSKFYEPSPTAILYVGPVSNVLVRVFFKLMPLFLRGNSAQTTPGPHTSSVTLRAGNSHAVKQTPPTSPAKRTSTSGTNGCHCGSLGGASLVWGVCWWERPRSCKSL